MVSIKNLFLLIIISFLSLSCFKDNDDIGSEKQTVENEINDFVWQGMNSWYNWQSQVQNLSDAKDDNINQYRSYLNEFSSPEDLFNNLLYQPNIVDRFSWFIDDYIVQENQFQGISKSFGIKFRSVNINTNGDVILYVRSVANNSPASIATIKRGDIINALNGTILNTANFNEAIQSLNNETVTFSFVTENNGDLTFKEDKTITSVIFSENPVHYKTIFNDINGRKVGYLVYNGFISSYNDELNEAFLFFKNENINELILDLRLNGGGSVETSAYLASMIYANASEDKFAELRFNSKHDNQNGSYYFTNQLNIYNSDFEKIGETPINRLNTINKLYVLTSSSTASASEMVINGLKPFMEVKTIGTTTYGKNVGSITLYDSPDSDFQNRASANPNHLQAMQPIVFQIYNKNDQSEYTQGFNPDIEIKEYLYWNNILAFGNENEIVLKAALDDIRGITSKQSPFKKNSGSKSIEFTTLNNKFEKEMYIEPHFFNKQ